MTSLNLDYEDPVTARTAYTVPCLFECTEIEALVSDLCKLGPLPLATTGFESG